MGDRHNYIPRWFPDLRFHLWEQQYQAEAERISTALSEVPDQYFQELEGEESSHLLALDGVLYLDKSQSRTLLFFNTQLSSFSFYGYLYCPEQKQLQEDYDFVHWIKTIGLGQGLLSFQHSKKR